MNVFLFKVFREGEEYMLISDLYLCYWINMIIDIVNNMGILNI